jgi:hypothetical protein
MRRSTKRRIGQLAILTVGIPVAAWALEEMARRTEARKGSSATSRRLQQGAEWLGHLGRGPLAARLRERRSATSVTRTDAPRS